MDPENDEQDAKKKDNDSLTAKGMKKGMQAASKKVKNFFKMVFRKIVEAISATIGLYGILIIAAVAVVIAAFTTILDFFNSSSNANVASMNTIQNSVSITAGANDEGYYFTIDQNVVETYTEELFKANQTDTFKDLELPDGDEDDPDSSDNTIDSEEDEEDDEEENIVYDEYDEEERESTRNTIEDWFQVENFEEYLVRMISAEIASSYPKLGPYEGGEEDSQGNKKDSNGDYVVQGAVQIHRQMMNQDGSVGEEFEMTYLPHEELTAMITANQREALNYFSFDEKTGLVYYATYKEVIVYVNAAPPPAW